MIFSRKIQCKNSRPTFLFCAFAASSSERRSAICFDWSAGLLDAARPYPCEKEGKYPVIEDCTLEELGGRNEELLKAEAAKGLYPVWNPRPVDDCESHDLASFWGLELRSVTSNGVSPCSLEAVAEF